MKIYSLRLAGISMLLYDEDECFYYNLNKKSNYLFINIMRL